MNENSIWWILGAIIITAVITVIGFIFSRNLPKKQKTLRIRKFAAVGLAFFFFCLPIFKPYISFAGRASFLEELKADNLNSIEEIAKFEKEQTRQIERLKNEAEHLREELKAVNLYYGFMIQILSTVIATACLIFVFMKREKDLKEAESD